MTMAMRFPEIAAQLVQLEKEDQKDVRSQRARLQDAPTARAKDQLEMLLGQRCQNRAERMLKLLHQVKDPSRQNIGLKGSRAVATLTLHSRLDIMKEIVRPFEALYNQNPKDVYYQAIPPLIDRIMILEERTQLFGTNWNLGADGQFYLIPVKQFSSVNRRRAQYGLGPVMRPVILAYGAAKYPLGRGRAKASDQRQMTDEEYAAYAKHHV